MKHPLVSIITTTYNRKLYLIECINSIIAQTYTNFELIIVDNFSNYDIESLLKSFNDDRIKLIQNDNNGKYVINRNIGVKNSKGEFIAFCDDDDLWNSDNLKIKMDYFEKNPSVGMITSKEEIIDEKGKKTGKTTHNWIKNTHFVTFKDLFFRNVGSPSAVIIRKKCFIKLGYFDENEDKLNIEDFDYWIKISLRFKILYLNKILGSFRIHSENTSYIDDRQLLNSFYLRKKILDKKNKEVLVFYSYAKLHIAKLKIKIAIFYLKKHSFLKSIYWFLQIFKP